VIEEDEGGEVVAVFTWDQWRKVVNVPVSCCSCSKPPSSAALAP
jgi:hypothetical protein